MMVSSVVLLPSLTTYTLCLTQGWLVLFTHRHQRPTAHSERRACASASEPLHRALLRREGVQGEHYEPKTALQLVQEYSHSWPLSNSSLCDGPLSRCHRLTATRWAPLKPRVRRCVAQRRLQG